MSACFCLNEMPVFCFFRELACWAEALTVLVAIVWGAMSCASRMLLAVSSDFLFVPRDAMMGMI